MMNKNMAVEILGNDPRERMDGEGMENIEVTDDKHRLEIYSIVYNLDDMAYSLICGFYPTAVLIG
jgi:hypothetical protein